MLHSLISLSSIGFVYLLFALTIVVLLLIIRLRSESKKESAAFASTLLINILLVLSFFPVLVSGLMVFLSLEIFGRISLSEPLNLVILSYLALSIAGTLFIMVKENIERRKKIYDSASLVLVCDLLILSFLAGFSIGRELAFLNLIVTLFLLMKAQNYKFIFFISLTLTLFFLSSYFLF